MYKYLLSYSLLLLGNFISCYGQSNYHASGNKLPDKNRSTVNGDTVSQTHDSILVVFQDSKRNYWFGSNGHGVYRYDGKALIHYTTKHGLCNNQIWKIQEDRSGTIFFTTPGGISQYSASGFHTLHVAKNDPATKGWKLQADDLWFQGAQDSGVVYRYDGKSLYRLEFPKIKMAEDFITEHPRSQFPAMMFNPYDVYSIFKDSKGTLWFGTGMLGVCRYDGKSFTWIPNDKIGMEEIAFCVRAIIEDKDGKFWFSNTKHRYMVSANNPADVKEEKGIEQSKDQYEAGYAYFMSGFEETNGDLWLATYGAGVWQYTGKDLIHYPVKVGNKIITLYSIYKDRQGALWLGTHTDGAYKFNGKSFERFNGKN